jgi:SNF2 family DNA or RNA helicase
MQVHKQKKALLLRLRNPEQVETVIPKAKTFDYKGSKLTAVPHDLDTVKVLSNLGMKPPSPIQYHYKWSGMYKPFEAQEKTAAFLTMNRRAFVLNDLGTGKTLSTLWAYDYLKKIGQVNKLLVVSPLSTLERVWADEIFGHFPHLTYAVLHGTRKKREALLKTEADVYIVNHDGVKVLQDELAKRDDIDIIVVDEISQCARNASTDRWKALKKVTAKIGWLWGLTGTPIPNEPTDAWAQCRLVVPDNVPPYYTRFRDTVMRQAGPYKWIPRDNALQTVEQAMQPSIRFHRSDCIDLPPLMYQTRQVPLSKQQQSMYNEMLKHLTAEHEGEQIQAVNEAVKLMKLVQIACGTAYSMDKEIVVVEPTERLNTLEELIQESNSKTIVFAPFTATVEMIAEHLRNKGMRVGVIYGGINKSQRDRTFHEFQKADELDVLVAQPAAMSHGLTLTAASTIVWFAPITSAETYEQANARITRPSQKHSQLIVNIEGSAVERRIYDKLKHKNNTQGILLDIIRGEM